MLNVCHPQGVEEKFIDVSVGFISKGTKAVIHSTASYVFMYGRPPTLFLAQLIILNIIFYGYID